MKELNMILVAGRHEIKEATDGSIFKHDIVDPTRVDRLETLAFGGIWDACYKHHDRNEKGYLVPDDEEDSYRLFLAKDLYLNIYVTGLTVALIATLNVCKENGIKVKLMHYDKNKKSYYAQCVK